MVNYKILLGTILSIISFYLKTKGQTDNVWAFGTKAGLDFNTGYPVPIYTGIFGGNVEGCASVCDVNGRLLFYTEGSFIWERNGNFMPNGENLMNIAGNFVEFSATSSTTQGALIVPVIGHSNQYYVFSLISYERGSYYGKLYYSIVDMNLNAGMGDVVPDKKGILLDSRLTEKMTAVAGGNCNIWLIVHVQASNSFHAWEITSEGISERPVISSVGNFLHYDHGVLKVSPDRKRLLTCNTFQGLEVYDFDPATGKVSNSIVLDKIAYYGAEFSPDNSKVYAVNIGGELFQFDLTASNPSLSKMSISSRLSVYGDLKLAPDGKIYLRGTTVEKLSVINYPDIVGSACQYTIDAISLLSGTGMGLGLPNRVSIIRNDSTLTTLVAIRGCFTNELSLQPSDTTGWSYIWSNGLTEASITVDTSGTYWVHYWSPPCNFHVDTFIVHFPNGVLPQLEIQAACAQMNNATVYAYTYPGDTVMYHYTWLNQAKDTLSITDTLLNVPSGTYYLSIKTAQCDTLISFFIPEENYKASFKTDSFVCVGEELAITNTSDTHYNGFQWYFGDGLSSILKNPKHTYFQPGSYEIQLIAHGNICSDTVSQTIYVDNIVSTVFHVTPESICIGESITLSNQMDNATIRELNWDFGDGNKLNNLLDKHISHSYNTAGIFVITLTSMFRACPGGIFTASIHVYDVPKVDLGADKGLCNDGAPLILENVYMSGSAPYRYLWSTGDTTPALKVTSPGDYSLTVISEPLGCSTTESIEIMKDCYLDIPNAFTPNEDGINDYFFPRQLLTSKVTNFRLQIFNRWGQLVFETTKSDGKGWDGKLNGKYLPQDVYVYLLDLEIAGKKQEHYKGNVTLVR